jgi:hypothetical protein
MRTFVAAQFILFIAFTIACVSDTAAQSGRLEMFRMHAAAPAEEVWIFPENPKTSRELLLQMALRIQSTDLDCSHFVHRLFERSGLPFAYAPSASLYKGEVAPFRRVHRPSPGDLIVWLGHVGIVVDPVEETFLSALRTGVKVSSYASTYWKKRGRARFFRYTQEPSHRPRILAMR